MGRTGRRLGRGLDSLISPTADLDRNQVASDPRDSQTASAPAAQRPDRRPTSKARQQAQTQIGEADAAPVERRLSPAPDECGALEIPINELQPNPFQPRTDASDADIESLAESIEQNGILQPLAIRRNRGRYEIIAGERRWWAAKSLGLDTVPVFIRDATDQQMVELALIENIQREDLNAIDRALAYREFCERFEIKPDEVARRLGEDRSTVVNYLRLLDLPNEIQDLVRAGKVGMGHARCLLGVSDDATRRELASTVARKGISVRKMEDIVRRLRTRLADDGRPSQPRSPHIADLERRFESALKTKVTIHEGKREGAGRITIEYFSLDDFDRLASALGVETD